MCTFGDFFVASTICLHMCMGIGCGGEERHKAGHVEGRQASQQNAATCELARMGEQAGMEAVRYGSPGKRKWWRHLTASTRILRSPYRKSATGPIIFTLAPNRHLTVF